MKILISEENTEISYPNWLEIEIEDGDVLVIDYKLKRTWIERKGTNYQRWRKMIGAFWKSDFSEKYTRD